MTSVLLVEDDPRLRIALRATFRARGYDVVEAETGEAGLLALAQREPQVVVLDLMLPGISGIDVLREARRASAVPVIVLTVRHELHDKLAAFDAGADDYVVKPFEPEELLARVQAQVRRGGGGPTAPTVFRSGDLEIDLQRRLVRRGGEPVALTPTEDRVLVLLASNPGRLLTYEEIEREAWRGRRRVDVRTRLRATVVSLRRKLGEDASEPRLIFTELGLGYRWIGPQDVVVEGPLGAGTHQAPEESSYR